MLIEIERAFLLPPNIENTLKSLGAKLFKQIKQHDTYFDTKNYTLLKNDYWLRTRNNEWELKYHPHSTKFKPNTSTSIYNEAKGYHNVHSKISSILSTEESNNLHPFAEFITDRKKYKIDYNQRKYSIDLDFTDFNYNMMEIETLVQNESEINDANQELNAFCGEIMFENMKIETMETPYTKIQMYLYHNNLAVHDLIVRAGKFPSLKPRSIGSKL